MTYTIVLIKEEMNAKTNLCTSKERDMVGNLINAIICHKQGLVHSDLRTDYIMITH